MKKKKPQKRRNINIKGGQAPKTRKKVPKAKKVKPKISLGSLYSFKRSKENDPLSRKIFDKKPSSFTKDEINKLVKGVNDRLYKLEKAGLAQESRAYQNIMRYAMGGDPAYNVDLAKGTVRLTQDMSRFKTKQEMYDYINRAQQILSNQTSSVGGTNKAIKKAYESFMKNYLGATLNFLDVDTVGEIYYSEEYEEMGSFPGENSVKLVDGVIYVKTENKTR